MLVSLFQLSNVRSNIKSHPLRRMLLTLDRTRRTSSRSRSHASRSSPYKSSCGCRRDFSLEIHSFASLTRFSTSSSLYATPIVASSFILPPIFSTTITPILPDGYFFLRTNIVKKLSCHPILGDTKIQNIVYQQVIKCMFFE